MKLTDDIIEALNKGIDKIGSKSEFAHKTGVNIQVLGQYVSKKTQIIKDDTWEKIYPFIKHYIPLNEKSSKSQLIKGLTQNQRILLDAYDDLSEEQQEKTLLDILKIARENIKQNNND